jgi:electron transport complex protein RnfB
LVEKGGEMGLAVVSLGGLGFLLSFILALAYAKLAIKLSEKEEKILESLPGANCGGCGYPGCEGYGLALAKGEAEVGECPVGGKELNERWAEILGIEAKKVEEKVAVVRCRGEKEAREEKFEYVGIKRCAGGELVGGGVLSCSYGCIGFGDCVEACKFGAIKIEDATGIPTIDDKKCVGCGICVTVCPKEVIQLISVEQKVYVRCSSPLIGKKLRTSCKVGCTGCKLCEKNCPYQAVKVENGVARIDLSRCQNCGICVYKCITKTIGDKQPSRPKAMIGTECNGCGECKEVCPMKAIEGKEKEQHKVDFGKCIGCGLCYKKCKVEAITMAFSLGYSEGGIK